MEQHKSFGSCRTPAEPFINFCHGWPNGRVVKTKVQIAQVRDVIIEVFSKEHAPPHFHVRCLGETEQYFQAFIVQPFSKVLADGGPVLADPEPDRLKGLTFSFIPSPWDKA